MKQYAERLRFAMECAGYDHHKDQSRLAAAVNLQFKHLGSKCKPQNIQHLLNDEKNVESSKYTLKIARVLQCDPYWLELNDGVAPVKPSTGSGYKPAADVVAFTLHEPSPSYWPFKASPTRFKRLINHDNLEILNGTIETMLRQRETEVEQPQPATADTARIYHFPIAKKPA